MVNERKIVAAGSICVLSVLRVDVIAFTVIDRLKVAKNNRKFVSIITLSSNRKRVPTYQYMDLGALCLPSTMEITICSLIVVDVDNGVAVYLIQKISQ